MASDECYAELPWEGEDVPSILDPRVAGDSHQGLLAVYSAGLGIPFLLAAFAMGPFIRFMRRFRSQMGKIEKAMGVFLVLTGIAFITGSFTAFGAFLLEVFPVLGRLG